MSLFKKIKDIFYDEEIVEVPTDAKKTEVVEPKKEVVAPKVESAPRIEPINNQREVTPEREKNISNYSERELFKPEKTFDFPVFEDDEPVKTRSRTNILEIQKELEKNAITKRETYSSHSERKVEEPREKSPSNFKPSPIISPIYGILDKNYKKEEIVEKKEVYKPSPTEKNYDYVRRKAYGTLEDELEDTLTKVNCDIVESVNELESELEALPKQTKNIEDLLSEIEKNNNTSIGELEERAKNKMLAEENEEEDEYEEETELEVKEEEKEEVNDNTLEHDLFNLIDSMYEDKEE